MEYKSNSHVSKELTKDKKEINPVAKAKIKKKSTLVATFISEDAQNIKNYILMDVLVPAIKKAVSDIVTDGISLLSDIVTDGMSLLLYGDTSHGNKRSSGSSSYVSYNRYSDRRDDINHSRPRYSYDDVILDTRGEAEEVLTRMDEILDTYGVVSVADLYDLVGISGSYPDNKYGWTNLKNAEPIRVRDGYLLKLPKAAPID